MDAISGFHDRDGYPLPAVGVSKENTVLNKEIFEAVISE